MNTLPYTYEVNFKTFQLQRAVSYPYHIDIKAQAQIGNQSKRVKPYAYHLRPNNKKKTLEITSLISSKKKVRQETQKGNEHDNQLIYLAIYDGLFIYTKQRDCVLYVYGIVSDNFPISIFVKACTATSMLRRCRVRHYKNDWFFTARQCVLLTIHIIENKKDLYQFLIQVVLSDSKPGRPGGNPIRSPLNHT